ncbi:MAG: hypothetical protein COU11_00240 [Candidatus Harrisonbacteria bacterium CG10_big_fil_rev_8_21_14_0_10_49_15]|uniref:Uncharacterized protein n=1 Tax=Candidatus Harrisonbacteria bacterium CG10_big_fil_rev_8_21_14_0_10_49_15 TaxID=1974587 RepID=A0A2H0UNU1_9BACT|nr:MAG: hypothetical protein COU11_00240 [Candidatus Harrisonbacteria bacterium CG10_big_fil_rev_8_21_14_0_10_49_15]
MENQTKDFLFKDFFESKTSQEEKKDEIFTAFIIDGSQIPESYFAAQVKKQQERGLGGVQLTHNFIKQSRELIVAEQRNSLERWLNYLKDSAYPDWFKIFTVKNIVGLSVFDREMDKFKKRGTTTVGPFPELIPEALARVFSLVKESKIEELPNFGRVYSEAFSQVDKEIKGASLNKGGILGQWRKFDMGSNPAILSNALISKGTGWCISDPGTSYLNLQDGDIYVYFTKVTDGQFTTPRIAIRMSYGKIAEVRGVAENQNLEPKMIKIAQEKIATLPGAAEYEKRISDMKTLADIDSRYEAGEELSIEDLRFIYEVDGLIENFGYYQDPRIIKILSGRKTDRRADLALIFKCAEEQIGLAGDEAIYGNIKYYDGSLDLNYIGIVEKLKLPERVKGDLSLNGITEVPALKLPIFVGGDLRLENIIDGDGLVFPEFVGGNLTLGRLKNASGLVLPKKVMGLLNLYSLESAEGLVLPEFVGTGIELSSLVSAKGLVLPKEMKGCSLELQSLKSAEGLILPEILNSGLNLCGLLSPKGLVLPKKIGGELNLYNLKNLDGLILPNEMSGDLYIPSVQDLSGVILPNMNGSSVIVANDFSEDKMKELQKLNPDTTILRNPFYEV